MRIYTQASAHQVGHCARGGRVEDPRHVERESRRPGKSALHDPKVVVEIVGHLWAVEGWVDEQALAKRWP